jgi:hypothetical protein
MADESVITTNIALVGLVPNLSLKCTPESVSLAEKLIVPKEVPWIRRKRKTHRAR